MGFYYKNLPVLFYNSTINQRLSDYLQEMQDNQTNVYC
jgi:hypothetical protein